MPNHYSGYRVGSDESCGPKKKKKRKGNPSADGPGRVGGSSNLSDNGPNKKKPRTIWTGGIKTTDLDQSFCEWNSIGGAREIKNFPRIKDEREIPAAVRKRSWNISSRTGLQKKGTKKSPWEGGGRIGVEEKHKT